MKKIIIFCILLLLTNVSISYSNDNKWITEDTIYQAIFSGLLIIDWLQTKEAVSNGIKENNFILGPHPSQNSIDAFGASVIIGHLVVSKILPIKYRRYWQVFTIGIESKNVNHNYKIGVRINF